MHRVPPAAALWLATLALAGAGGRDAAAQTPPDDWSAQLEFGLNGASGNTSFSVLRTGGSLKRLETESFEFDLSVLVRYGKNEETVIANDQRAALKFDWRPQATFSPFTFVTTSRDRLRRLDAKVNAGAGLKWAAHREESTNLDLSFAALWDYENFDLVAGSTASETSSVARWSGRIELDHSFDSGAKFEHTTHWLPEFTAFGDYQIEATSSVTTNLLTRLSVVIQHEFLYDSVPPPDVGKRDQKYSVVLRVSL